MMKFNSLKYLIYDAQSTCIIYPVSKCSHAKREEIDNTIDWAISLIDVNVDGQCNADNDVKDGYQVFFLFSI